MMKISNNTFKQFGLALTLASCSSMASAGLIIDTISVKMTNTSYSARSAEALKETDSASAYNDARSAFDSSFSTQGFCDRSLNSLADITARDTCNGNRSSYGALYTISGTNTGVAEFQFGLDWGRGGFIKFEGSDSNEIVRRTDDVWWGRNWGNRDVINYSFSQIGDFTLTLLGFEACCDGVNAVRYTASSLIGGGNNNTIGGGQTNPGAPVFQTLTVNAAAVPVAGTLPLLGLGAAGLLLRRRRKQEA